MKNKWSAAFQLAAVYVGTVVGAGFATGKEIVEFFSQFGVIGLIGILISGTIFAYLGSKLMRISVKLKARSYQEFTIFLFGKVIGTFINSIMLIMLVGVCAVMLSGAGAVFEEQLGISKGIGVIFTISLSLIVMMVGMKGLFAVNTFVVPIMISFSFILFFLSVQLPEFIVHIFAFTNNSGWKSIAAPFSYTALNLSLAIAVLVPAASEIGDDETVKWGGIIGGIALMFILISSHFTLIMLHDVDGYAIPMATIMKNLAPQLSWIYILVIYGEIFTSVIGNVYGLERQLSGYIKLPSILIIVFIFFISYMISFIHYGTLLSFLYPLFGYISLVFLLILWIKPIPQDQW
ncbi:YkvI family membrane protein [Niallia sp. 03133]|uniref:YkvI family membrane protein n=1 Tax=Niallia sp. 03133 TaxID=3458060 RepID=UPI0040443362